MKRIISIDPGEHIGIITVDRLGIIKGYTYEGACRNALLYKLFNEFRPEIIIFEQFALRAKSASKLVGDKFVTCEVIGVVKLYSQLLNVPLIELQPFDKEYCGFSSNPKDIHYKVIDCGKQKITEHVRDAYRLYSYAKLFKLKV